MRVLLVLRQLLLLVSTTVSVHALSSPRRRLLVTATCYDYCSASSTATATATTVLLLPPLLLPPSPLLRLPCLKGFFRAQARSTDFGGSWGFCFGFKQG